MDKRGLTIDPNADRLVPEWWENLGPTQAPSPYADASWVYRHSFVTEDRAEKTTKPIEYEFDNGDSFAEYKHEETYDSGFFNTPRAGALILDEGGFTQTGDPIVYVKQYFGSIKVYDSKASYPAPEQLEQRMVREDRILGHMGTVVDLDTATILDNSDDITDPIPNPSVIIDSMLYPRGGLGEIYDEMEFLVYPNGVQQVINYSQTSVPDYDDDDHPRGTLLGEVNYEILGESLTITDWSHYNWHDAQPVRKAVKILVKEKPDCAEMVLVQNSPTPFWKSLGFECPYKGSDMLIHRDSLNRVSAY